MENPNYICGARTHAYGQGYIGLPVTVEGLPQEISVGEINLQAKSTFHVSLLCVKYLIRKYGESVEQDLLSLFCEFTRENSVSFVRYTGEFRFAEMMERKSIIAMCEVSNLESFFELARRELRISLQSQPTHVTLYTLQPELGIGLNTQRDIDQKTRPILVPDRLTEILGAYNMP
ncbi:MAG TPA: hypothetical protein VF696_01645 [Candidatus Paceibacterota bacterium]|jgi:hypothetical protein